MNQYLKVLLIFLLALALRVGYAAYVGLNEPRFDFNYDSREYHDLALHVSQGQGLHLGNKLTAKRPPVYPLFLAALFTIFGADKIWVVKLAQCLIGALTCLLVYWLAKEIFDSKTALLAMAISAVYPHFIFYPAYLMSETQFQFLLLGMLHLLYKLEADFSPLRLLLCGLILGLAVLCRPVLAYLPLFLFFWYVLFHHERLRGVATALVLGIGMMLVILPWATRNYLALDAFVPLSTQSGVTLYGGNNLALYDTPRSRGGWLVPPVMFINLKEDVENLKYWQLTLEFWRNHPKESLILLPYKFWRFWNPWPQTELLFRLVSLFTYLPILLLFLYYLIFVPGKIWELLVPLLGIIVYFTLFSLLVYGSTRFRFPIEPLLIILAAKALGRGERFAGDPLFKLQKGGLPHPPPKNLEIIKVP